MESGQWLCHESCWTDASQTAIEQNRSVDIECHGGIRLYTVPIRTGQQVVGAINFGYSNPPRDPDRLEEIAALFQVEADELRKLAVSYETRPPYMLKIAKQRLAASARLIGEMVRRKTAEMELVRQKNRFEAIFNSMNEAVVYTDTERRILSVNPAFTRLFRYEPEEVIGQTARFMYVDQADFDRRTGELDQSAPDGSLPGFRAQYRRKDGKVITVDISGSGSPGRRRRDHRVHGLGPGSRPRLLIPDTRGRFHPRPPATCRAGVYGVFRPARGRWEFLQSAPHFPPGIAVLYFHFFQALSNVRP